MSNDLEPFTPRAGGLSIPEIIRRESRKTTRRFLEFFTANIHNPSTRAAYVRAGADFLKLISTKRPSG